MVKNKQCLSCSTKYSHCPDCSKVDALKPSWASEFCSEECMVIWKTATKHNLGMISKSDAKSIVSELSLKPTEQYVKCIQRDLAKILAEDPKPKRGKRVLMPVIDEAISCEATNDAVETTAKIIDDKNIVEEKTILDDIAHEVVNKIEEE